MKTQIVVKNTDGQLVTTSLAIAEGTGVQHKNVIELVRTHSSDLTDFGGIAFETQSFETTGGIQYREVAILNGRLAAAYSKANNIPIDKTRDARFGMVNMYHEAALENALEEIHGGM